MTKVTHLVMREQKEEVGRGQGKKRTCSQGLKFPEPPKVMSPAVDHSFTTRVCREHFTFKLTAFHKHGLDFFNSGFYMWLLVRGKWER